MLNAFPTAASLDTQDARPARQGLIILITLCLAVLIAQIDTSVVNLAVQPIGRYFHARVATLQWVIDAYNLVYAPCCSPAGSWQTSMGGVVFLFPVRRFSHWLRSYARSPHRSGYW